MKPQLKVIVIPERAEEFKEFCKKNKIVCRSYDVPALKGRFGVDADAEDLHEAAPMILYLGLMPSATGEDSPCNS